MTQKWLPGSHRRVTPSDSKVTRKWLNNGVRSHFWVNFGSLWGRSAQVTFESLLGHFNSFWLSVELGARWLHNGKHIYHVIIQELSRNCPGLFRKSPRNFVCGIWFVCFPFHPRKGQHINKLTSTRPFPGRSREVVYSYWVFLPRSSVPAKWVRTQMWSHGFNGYELFKLSAYKVGVSMRLFKLQFLSLFKLPFSISGENRSLNGHLRATFGLKWAVKTPKPKTGA